jgi:hypothetical protein
MGLVSLKHLQLSEQLQRPQQLRIYEQPQKIYLQMLF